MATASSEDALPTVTDLWNSTPAWGVPFTSSASGQRHVLASGFWGLSRHVNYLGELVMASALTLSLGYPLSWQPWLYPLYYVVLLFPRQYQAWARGA